MKTKIKRIAGDLIAAIGLLAVIINFIVPVAVAIACANAVWLAWWGVLPGTVSLLLGALVLRDILWEV